MALNVKNVEMSDSEFSELCSIVHKQTGITIGAGRKSMLFSRLRPRLRITGTESFEEYIGKLSDDAVEMQEFTNCVTTNETYFYRTPRVWEHFTECLIPRHRALPRPRPMKVWSAAASTGEEAHTIGVILEETRLLHPGFDYSVLGTDISTRVLKIAEEGVYNGRAINRFRTAQPELFAKHMKGDDEAGFKAADTIRQRLKFRVHNLLKAMQNGGPFDVVFLRNVLIYFREEEQSAILQNMSRAMQPGATLFIGESETLNNLKTGFVQVAPIIYRWPDGSE